MKKLIEPRRELVLLLITFLPVLFLFIFWKQIPERIPSHWNIHGEVDDYSSRYFTPLMGLGLYLLLLVVPFIDPKKRNYEFFTKAYFSIRLSLALIFAVIGLVSYYYAMGHHVDMVRIVVSCVMLLFIVMGNFMGNIRPNWFVGIRTPWTMENETVWVRTHRLGGKLWFWGGLLILALLFIVPEQSFVYVFVPGILILALTPFIYSYWIYRKLKHAE